MKTTKITINDFKNYINKIEWDYTNPFFCLKIAKRPKFKKLFAANEAVNTIIWNKTVIEFHIKRQTPSKEEIFLSEQTKRKKQEEREVREYKRDQKIKKLQKGKNQSARVELPTKIFWISPEETWITPEEEMELTRDTWR